jgi:two-component system, cell cycle response regulator
MDTARQSHVFARHVPDGSFSGGVDVLDSLAEQIRRIKSITSDQTSSASELAELLSEDELLIKKILQFANSDLLGKANNISTLKQAVIRIGFKRIRNLGIELLLFNTVVNKFKLPMFDNVHFWQHCSTVAAISRSIGEKIHYSNLDEAYLAGLFHDVGKMLLYMHGAISYGEFLEIDADPEMSITDHERSIMGLGHDELGASYLQQCGFSERLVMSARYHHQRYDESILGLDGARLTALVQLSDFVAWTQGIGSLTGMDSPVLPPETERIIDLERVGVSNIISAVEPQLKWISGFYQLSLPNNSKIRGNLFQASLQLGKLKTRYLYLENYKSETEKISQHSKMLLTPHRSLDSDTIFDNTMSTIRQDLSYDESWVFSFNQEKRIIVAGQFPGSMLIESKLLGRRFSVKENDKNILNCLRNRKPVLILGDSKIEKKLLSFIDAKKATIAPIVGAGRIHGLVCLVRREPVKVVDQDELEVLAAIFHEMGLALDNALLYSMANERATRDKLTGIMNRMGLDENFEKAFAKAQSKNRDLSVAMVDIDFFKLFNDKFGHGEGDRVLKLVAQVLKKSTRVNGLVGRYGGEEFLIVLKNTNIDDALIYCERVRKSVEKLGMVLSKRLLGRALTISIGIASLHKKIKNPKQLVQQADQALYKAKNSGRNMVVKYHPDPKK